jgi:hypothetical protein
MKNYYKKKVKKIIKKLLGDNYVHRLINSGDGKIIELPNPKSRISG